MRKAGILSKLLVGLLIASLSISVIGCGSNNEGKDNDTAATTTTTTTTTQTTAEKTTTSEPKEEPVHLTMLWPEEAGAVNINTYLKDNLVYKEIVKQTNVEFEVLGWNDEKLKISIASGDLPDIVSLKDNYTKIAYDAKQIVDLLPLMEKTGTQENLLYCPARVKYAKDYLSTEGIYFLTPMAFGPEVVAKPAYPMIMAVGPTVRWDYYKELDCPSIKSFDDYLNVLEQMVKKHPTTPDGKKTYGIGMFNDWNNGVWYYELLTSSVSGTTLFSYVLDVTRDNQMAVDEFFGPANIYREASNLLNKAYRKGLLHPESFTMKYADFEAAVVRGEILSNAATYGTEKGSAELMKGDKPTSFMTIPFDFGYAYSYVAPLNQSKDYQGGRGYSGKNWSITTNCKTPEKAIKLLDFCFSAEGTRLINNGVQGVHWDYVDGKPVIKDEVIKANLAQNDEWQKMCLLGSLSQLQHLRGRNSDVLHPDGYFVNLWAISSSYQSLMNPVQKDYAKHYEVEYPFQAFQKKLEQGLNKFNPDYKKISLPTEPEEIKRITTKLLDIYVKGLPKTIIEPKTDAEWEKAIDKLRNELIAAGALDAFKWAKEQFEIARQKMYNP